MDAGKGPDVITASSDRSTGSRYKGHAIWPWPRSEFQKTPEGHSVCGQIRPAGRAPEHAVIVSEAALE